MKPYTILIATPLAFPDIGGPSLYAKLFSTEWKKQGFTVRTVTWGSLSVFPMGLRNVLFLFKILPKLWGADVVYVLDTFSVAVPTVLLCHIFRKKVVVRVGGDFLWESYVQRTREHILLSEFYTKEIILSFKENMIFDLTNFVFKYADQVVFSTEWQKGIFLDAYTLDTAKVHVIENMYTEKVKRNIVPKERVILSPSRNIFLKNKVGLTQAFALIKERFFDVSLDTNTSTHAELLVRMSRAYCVVVPSLSEVSPNIVLDAISLGVPVVVTEDCGIKERLGDIVVWVNPKKPESIAAGIESLMDSRIYSEYMGKISKFSYVRSEEAVAKDFLNIGLL